MTRNEAINENTIIDPVGSNPVDAKVIPHPALHSMGQVLAGEGELVFEGELLEAPLNWHPSGTRH